MQKEPYRGEDLFTAKLGVEEKVRYKRLANERGMTLSAAIRAALPLYFDGEAEPLCPRCEGAPIVAPRVTDTDDAFGHWLSGFIDGEGCFKISRISRSVTYKTQFAITLRQDDREILASICERTGLGRLYEHDNIRKTSHSKPTVTWSVQSKRDLRTMVDLIDRYPLRAKKARDYALWREATLLWCAYQGNRWHANSDPWGRMAELHEELRASRVYVPAAA